MRAFLVTLVLLAAAATASAAPPALTLRTPLPDWLAPGARFTVEGATDAGGRVYLVSDSTRIGSVEPGAGGRRARRRRQALAESHHV